MNTKQAPLASFPEEVSRYKLPPKRSAIFRQIVSPNPVPCLKSSCFSKRSNIFSAISSGTPQPVSDTIKRTVLFSRSISKLKFTSPVGVNLSAFESKSPSNCCKRNRSVFKRKESTGIHSSALHSTWLYYP